MKFAIDKSVEIEKVENILDGKYIGVTSNGEWNLFEVAKIPEKIVEKLGDIGMAWADEKRCAVCVPDGLSLAQDMNAEICASALKETLKEGGLK